MKPRCVLCDRLCSLKATENRGLHRSWWKYPEESETECKPGEVGVIVRWRGLHDRWENVSKQQEHLKQFNVKVLLLRVRFRQPQSLRINNLPLLYMLQSSLNITKKAPGLKEWKAILTSEAATLSHIINSAYLETSKMPDDLSSDPRQHFRQKQVRGGGRRWGAGGYDHQGKNAPIRRSVWRCPNGDFCESHGGRFAFNANI